MASTASYLKDEMRNQIESATTAMELQPALEHVPLDAIKSFLNEQMNQKSDSELKSIHYATLSIDVILSEDVIQSILSFDCPLRHKAVNKRWKSMSEKNESNWMRKRMSRAIIENDRSKFDRRVREPMQAWWLFNESRGKRRKRRRKQSRSRSPSSSDASSSKETKVALPMSVNLKVWEKMSDEDRRPWIQKELAERAEWQRMKKHYGAHFCHLHVPERWINKHSVKMRLLLYRTCRLNSDS